jgi:hypothetical protein
MPKALVAQMTYEPVEDRLLRRRLHAAVEVRRRQPGPLQAQRGVLAGPAGRAVDDDAAGAAQLLGAEVQDPLVLVRGAADLDLEGEIGPRDPAVEQAQLLAELSLEVGQDLGAHVRPGGRRQGVDGGDRR